MGAGPPRSLDTVLKQYYVSSIVTTLLYIVDSESGKSLGVCEGNGGKHRRRRGRFLHFAVRLRFQQNNCGYENSKNPGPSRGRPFAGDIILFVC